MAWATEGKFEQFLTCLHFRQERLDIDGTLTLIFTKSLATQNIITKILVFLQLAKKWILTKFGGHSSKNMSTTPITIFRGFWWEIQILGTLCTDLSRLTIDENMVLISFGKFNFDRLISSSVTYKVRQYSKSYFIRDTWKN